jgi:hypothetical protein
MNDYAFFAEREAEAHLEATHSHHHDEHHHHHSVHAHYGIDDSGDAERPGDAVSTVFPTIAAPAAGTVTHDDSRFDVPMANVKNAHPPTSKFGPTVFNFPAPFAHAGGASTGHTDSRNH